MPLDVLTTKVVVTAPDGEGDARFEAAVLLRNSTEHLWERLDLEVRVEDAEGEVLLTDTATHPGLDPEEAVSLGTETWVHLGEAVPARASCTLRLQRTERVTAPASLRP